MARPARRKVQKRRAEAIEVSEVQVTTGTRKEDWEKESEKSAKCIRKQEDGKVSKDMKDFGRIERDEKVFEDEEGDEVKQKRK